MQSTGLFDCKGNCTLNVHLNDKGNCEFCSPNLRSDVLLKKECLIAGHVFLSFLINRLGEHYIEIVLRVKRKRILETALTHDIGNVPI